MKKVSEKIIWILIGVLSSGVVSYATSSYMAKDIVYKTSYNNKIATAEDALNDLYGSASSFANPTGAIISMMSNNAPSGYLICDGTTYNINEYKKLAEFIKAEFGSYNYFGGDGETTFAVPDLRGEFLRGTGTNSHDGQGSGVEVGIHQDGSVIQNPIATNINNTFLFVPKPSNVQSVSLAAIKPDSFILSENNGYTVIGEGYTSHNATFITAYTSRPTNTSVLYCIKY